MSTFTLTVSGGKPVSLKTLKVDPLSGKTTIRVRDSTRKEAEATGVTYTKAHCTARLDALLSDELFHWVAGFVKGFSTSKTATFDSVGTTGNVEATSRLSDARLKSVSFSSVDATAKDPVEIQMTIGGDVKYLKGSGTSAGKRVKPSSGGLLRSNFSLEIGNLPTENVIKIKPIQIDSTRNTKLEFQALATDLGPYRDWLEEEIYKGATGPGSAKDAELALLDTALKKTIVSIQFRGLRPQSIRHGRTATKEAVQTFDCELSCAGLTLAAVSS